MEKQLNSLKQLIGNVELHLAYNHPEEAVKLLAELVAKAELIKYEIEGQE